MNTKELFSPINKRAQSEGAQCELLAVSSSKFSASYQKGAMDKFDHAVTQSFGVRVVKDGKEGSAFTESSDSTDLEKCYSQAMMNAQILEKPYTPEILPAGEPPKSLNLFSDSLTQVSVDDRLNAAKELEESCLNYSKYIAAVPYGGYSDFTSTVSLVNSHGLELERTQNGCSAMVYPFAKKGELTGISADYCFARDFNKMNIKSVAESAAKEAVFKIDSQVPKTGVYSVVLKNTAAASFIGLLAGHFSAKAADQKTSLFTNSVGKQIAASGFTLIDNPLLEESFGSRNFDGEGQATQANTLIDQGTFTGFLTNSVYAKKLGLKNTASASRSPKSELGIQTTNLVVEGNTETFKNLVSSANKVVVIDNLKGMAGVNAVSGDFSIESEGLLFENGELKHGLKNFVASGNLVDVLKNIKAMGDDTRLTLSGIKTPSLLIGELSLAGN